MIKVQYIVGGRLVGLISDLHNERKMHGIDGGFHPLGCPGGHMDYPNQAYFHDTIPVGMIVFQQTDGNSLLYIHGRTRTIIDAAFSELERQLGELKHIEIKQIKDSEIISER